MKYMIVIEQTGTGYSAYCPDLEGCVAVGSTREEIETNIREAIEFHVESLRHDGIELPRPTCYSTYVEIPA